LNSPWALPASRDESGRSPPARPSPAPVVPFQRWAKRRGISTYSAHPLLLEERLVGLLELYSPQTLDEAMLLALEAVSRSLALGVERLRAEEQVARALQQLEMTMETVPEAVLLLDSQAV
jgi:GAF domain-containing protein